MKYGAASVYGNDIVEAKASDTGYDVDYANDDYNTDVDYAHQTDAYNVHADDDDVNYAYID